jgi:hypothetical protein
VEEDYKKNVVAALPRDLAAEPEFWNVLTSLRSVTDVTVIPISFGEAGIARQARTSEQNTLHECWQVSVFENHYPAQLLSIRFASSSTIRSAGTVNYLADCDGGCWFISFVAGASL